MSEWIQVDLDNINNRPGDTEQVFVTDGEDVAMGESHRQLIKLAMSKNLRCAIYINNLLFDRSPYKVYITNLDWGHTESDRRLIGSFTNRHEAIDLVESSMRSYELNAARKLALKNKNLPVVSSSMNRLRAAPEPMQIEQPKSILGFKK